MLTLITFSFISVQNLLTAWDYAKNNEAGINVCTITCGSGLKAWWRWDTCRGEYQMSAYDKIKGTKCPYCADRKVLKGFNDLRSCYPELIDSSWNWRINNANNLKPDEIIYKSSIKACWHCTDCNGDYDMQINDKTMRKHGCPYCSGHKVLKGFNDFQSKYDKLVNSEWDWERNNARGIHPDKLTPNSNMKAYFTCNECKGSYIISIYRKTHGYNCPYCAGMKILKGYNDIASQYPALISSEWNWERNNELGIKPNMLTKCSHVKAWWHCTVCNGEYQMRIYNKTSGQGCPYCSNAQVLQGYNDLASCYPDLVNSEWDWERNNARGIHPNGIIKSSSIIANWLCSQHHHSFEMQVTLRTRSKSPLKCPYCSNQKLLKGFNDFESKHPDLMVEWNWSRNNKLGIKPDELINGSHKKVWWLCSKCGHEWKAQINNRVNANKTGCPACWQASHKSRQENEVAEYMQSYLCEHHMNHTMHRSIKIKRIYEMMNLNADTIFSNSNSNHKDLRQHLLKEIDIYIPELNLAVEYDGDYWHNDSVMLTQRGMTNEDAHMIKQKLCSQAGIKIIFITEHDWLNYNQHVKQHINLIMNETMNATIITDVLSA